MNRQNAATTISVSTKSKRIVTGMVCILMASAMSAQIPWHDDMQPGGANNISNHVVTHNYPPLKKSLIDKDLETIRQRVILDLQKPAVDKAEVARLISTLREDGTWPGINYTDVSRTGFEHRIHLENMLTLSRAISKNGSSYYNNAEAQKTLSTALNFWIKNDFRCDNWWWNEMGTPQLMINTLLMMDTRLTDHQKTAGLKIANRANLEAFGARPGGDLIPIAGMLGKQALFSRDAAVLERVINVMASQIEITTGRGIKPDLSFHHRVDNVISTLTYGTSFAGSFAYWAVLITGTRFSLPADALKLLIDYYLDGICKSMVYGIYPDPGAENRDMTRMNALKAAGSEIPENLRKITHYRAAELDEIISLRKGLSRPTASTGRFFWHSSYLVHQRPKFFSSVRMHSARANNMEEPHNEEGLKMHHFGDGSNFIQRRGNEYLNIYPVWDWQKIPGTTILQNKDVPHWKEVAKKGISEFSGGLSNGKYSVAAIDLVSVHDPLKAKKAWFFFDNEYVCLGADISANSDLPVVTTMNQTLLHTPVTVSKSRITSSISKGNHHLENVDWVLHDSVAYVFPEAMNVEMINQAVTGNWRQINHQSWATTDPVSKDVFGLWINHGNSVKNASYVYAVVPNTSAVALDGYLAKAGVSVISNTGALQAVTNTKLGITQFVFYRPGTAEVNGKKLTVSDPCIVMMTKDKLVVSEPTQKLDKITITIPGQIIVGQEGVYDTWNASEKTTTLKISLPDAGQAGSSVSIPLKK